VFKLKGPAEHGDEVDFVAVLELKEALESGGGIRGIQGVVAVVVRRVDLGGAGGAAFGVSFAEDDGKVDELRVLRHGFEALVGADHFVIEAHANMAFDNLRLAFDVERDEVHWNGLAIRRAFTRVDVLEEIVEEGVGFGRARAGGRGAPDEGSGQRGANAGYGKVVELEIILLGSVPILDVGLV